MRYFVQFSYLGTNYHGSQTQPNGVTVQETMEKAFSTILREPIALTFAGRTDAGVHAQKMVAHFDYPTTLNSKLPPQAQLSTTLNSKLYTLNSLLPDDIAVEKIWEVSDDLHARFSAVSRTYEYRITTKKDPFLIDRATRVKEELNFEAMNKAASYLLGTHD
ncbi:MAG: tRNA pseudouridine(38-40) synthase TruA, partial [Paludibacteraceae bacterium]|nr:tRNA pseudouridine(38-40) synthase TruA [Paludibacteraceae bacterium]